MCNSEIEIVEQAKYLGVILDSELNFKYHSNWIKKKLASKVGFFNRISWYLNTETKIKLYQSLISPHIDYCSSVLFMLNKNDIDALQKIQNKAVRTILKANKYTPIQDMYDALSWLKVKERILLNTLTFIHRIHIDLVPEYLKKKLTPREVNHKYNTRNLRKSKTKITYTITKAGENTIYSKGIRIYNRIPHEIREIVCIKSFRRECCTLIKEQRLKPLPFEKQGLWDT